MGELNNLINMLGEIKKEFNLVGGSGVPKVNSIHSNSKFLEWKQEIQFELQRIHDKTKDKFIWDTLVLVKQGFNGWNDEKNYNELSGYLMVIQKNINLYEPDMMVSSGLNKSLNEDQILEEIKNYIAMNSGGKRPLTLLKIQKDMRSTVGKLDANRLDFYLNTLVEHKVIRKSKGNRYRGPDGKMTSDDQYEILRGYMELTNVVDVQGGSEVLMKDQVFIIHGHDEGMKLSVQLLMERAGMDGVVLHEQLDNGRTIIEKLIGESIEAGYAIALLSPDDVTEEGVFRARQNVILEIGYFIGLLGRDKVRILVKGNVDIPSDLQGIIYEPFDPAGNWRLKLLKEIQGAGIKVDIDKVLTKL